MGRDQWTNDGPTRLLHFHQFVQLPAGLALRRGQQILQGGLAHGLVQRLRDVAELLHDLANGMPALGLPIDPVAGQVIQTYPHSLVDLLLQVAQTTHSVKQTHMRNMRTVRRTL